MGEQPQRPVDIAAQCIDPKVDRSTRQNGGLGLAHPAVAELSGEPRRHPFGHTGLHPFRWVVRLGRQTLTLFVRQDGGTVSTAAEQALDFLKRAALSEGEKPEHQRPPVLGAHRPSRGPLGTQGVIDSLRNRPSVFRAGEPVVAAPGPQHPVRRCARGRDLIEDLDGGGETGGWGHEILWLTAEAGLR